MHEPGDDLRRQPRRPAPTLVHVSSSRQGAPVGEALALTAEVRTPTGVSGPATGNVLFRAGLRLLGSAPLDGSGAAVLGGVLLEPGVHAITASYAGDDEHAAATSTSLPQAVTLPTAPVSVVVCAPRETVDGVVLEAELVDRGSGRLVEVATGALVFAAGSTSLAAADLIAGRACVTVPELPPGRLQAAFAGDTEHSPATGFLDEAAGD